MILSDLNYLELVSEKKIVGGGLTATSTYNTFSLAYASTTPSGDISTLGIVGAASGATGTDTSAMTLTSTYAYASDHIPFTYASAHALGIANASTDNNFESSSSNAHSTSVGTSFGSQTIEYGSSLSFS